MTIIQGGPKVAIHRGNKHIYENPFLFIKYAPHGCHDFQNRLKYIYPLFMNTHEHIWCYACKGILNTFLEMIYVSYLFLIHHGLQVPSKIKIKGGEIWGSGRPLHRTTPTNSGNRKLLIQPLTHGNTIMRWCPIMLEVNWKVDGMIVSCNMLRCISALRFPLI